MHYRAGCFQVGSPEWRAQHGQITKLNLQVLPPDQLLISASLILPTAAWHLRCFAWLCSHIMAIAKRLST